MKIRLLVLATLALFSTMGVLFAADEDKPKKKKAEKKDVTLKIETSKAVVVEGGDTKAKLEAKVTITNNEKDAIVVSHKQLRFALREGREKVGKLVKDKPNLLDAYQLPAGETTKNPVTVPLSVEGAPIEAGKPYTITVSGYGQRARAPITFEKKGE